MDKADSLDRFLALVRREFGATDARVLAATDAPLDGENLVTCELGDGRKLVATFAEPRGDGDVIARRLRILADTFAESLGSAHFRAKRAATPVSLAEELRALATRSHAADAVVIDVDSPVIWGSALGPMVSRTEPPPALVSRPQLLSGEWDDADSEDASDRGRDGSGDGEKTPRTPLRDVSARPGAAGDASEEPEPEATVDAPSDQPDSDSVSRAPVATSPLARAAIDHVRSVPEVANAAHRGKHVRHTHVVETFGYLATSFSSIYLLVLVYPGAFDEILAERATQDAMSRVERLVLALPPLDPEPEPFGQAISIRRRRR